HTLEFAAGDDVEARAKFGQHTQDCERGVGLDGIAKRERVRLIATSECGLKQLEALTNVCSGVNVQRRAVGIRQCIHRYAVAAESAVQVTKGTGGCRNSFLSVAARSSCRTSAQTAGPALPGG